MSTFTNTSTNTFKESEKTVWFLETVTHNENGRKLHHIWCEFNGKEVTGTRKMMQRLSKDLKQMFNLNK